VEALGRLYNLACGVAPVDLASGATTGNRVHLKDYSSVDIVFFKEAGAASEATTLDVQQHTAASGGTSQDLDVVTHYYLQSETTLDADETWTKVTQSAASEVTPAASDTQQILAIHVDATSLADGFEWVSVTTTDTTTAGQIGSVLYILNEPMVQRSPDALAQPQA
jgi:hypothetical protein